MARLLTAALLGLLFASLPPRAASAAECAPYCDYNHYYGPADLTYQVPGQVPAVYCYPVCNARGECLPRSACVQVGPPRGRVIVRTFVRPR